LESTDTEEYVLAGEVLAFNEAKSIGMDEIFRIHAARREAPLRSEHMQPEHSRVRHVA